MKMETWLDRLYVALWGVLLAQVLGPETLGSWMLALATAWLVSPWPPTTLTTRLVLGMISLSLTSVVVYLWPWAQERAILFYLVSGGLWSFRMLHALPIARRVRIGITLASLIGSAAVLIFSRSLLAALWTSGGVALVGLFPGFWLSRHNWGRLEIPRWRSLWISVVTTALQIQILYWLHAMKVPLPLIGSLAAALLTLEIVKVGLVTLTLRYDDALARFSPTRESFLETIRSLAVYGLLVMAPTVLVVYFGANVIVETLFGPAFGETILWLRLLIWGFAFSFFSVLGSRILQLKQTDDSIGRARLAQTGIEAFLAFYWIPTLGVEGACYARVLSEAAGFLIIAIHVNRVVPGLINPFRRTFG